MENNKRFLFFLITVILLIVSCDDDPYKDWDSKVTIEMVWIDGGTFIMGSPNDEPGRMQSTWESTYGIDWDVERQHSVTLTKGFYIGKYPITQMQYTAVRGDNPSKYEKKDTRFNYFIDEQQNFPVEGVTWYDAVEFCNLLSMREKRKPVYKITNIERGGALYHYRVLDATVEVNWEANGYRLPTEAEWEYACRAGTTTPFYTGNDITTDQAFYDKTFKGTKYFWSQTVPVGKFAPNAWGLYDMHGNVNEWCWDWFGDYGSIARTDPTGECSTLPATRVVRGGAYSVNSDFLRSACRRSANPYMNFFSDLGFRVVRNK